MTGWLVGTRTLIDGVLCLMYLTEGRYLLATVFFGLFVADIGTVLMDLGGKV